MKNIIHRFIHDQSGAVAIEYAMLIALISLALIAAASTLAQSIGTLFNNIGNKLTTLPLSPAK
ncbi:hypothetical protein B488_12890 [Liberibacter crescens BT-1]|uniref:Flp pilus assembly protein, pilin Flp n=1 Tax=Liberibacter crescens (strain BT-1) TaxID=1215343 RepID=L0EY21_LIBCB|nr:Flp family type IVb pilin [Liberibacter crescens]AGA65281.1 hypothetical protein B488_12890 [Liberibacter crescens BT-1]AMC13212.1 pilus assembly protein [Liberibacter crescens]